MMALAITGALLFAAGVFYFVFRLSRLQLPAASTFKEGQRALALWLLSAGGVFCGLTGAGIIFLLSYGPWTPATEVFRAQAVAWLGGGFQVGVVLVLSALMIGGPVGRFKGSVGKDGATGELERDEDD